MSTLIECGASPFIPGFALKDVRLENGLTVRVAIGGSGSPLVLLHGHPQNHTTWRKVAPTLAQNHTVILPDLRGYGDSDKPTSDPGAPYLFKAHHGAGYRHVNGCARLFPFCLCRA